MLRKKQFTVAKWGSYPQTKWGYQWIPDTLGSYPLVIFSHGLGTVGSDSASVDSLLSEGPFKVIKDGWTPNYVFIGIQGASYPVEIENDKYVIDNDPEIRNAWDGKNILWTGLSAGGLRTLEAAAKGMAGVFVPMSSPAFDANKIDSTKTYNAWAFHSDNDTQCPLVSVNAAYQKLKAKMTIPHDGHGNWTNYYDPKSQYGNIYEWAFGSAVPIPVPVPTSKNVISTIRLYDDNTYEKS